MNPGAGFMEGVGYHHYGMEPPAPAVQMHMMQGQQLPAAIQQQQQLPVVIQMNHIQSHKEQVHLPSQQQTPIMQHQIRPSLQGQQLGMQVRQNIPGQMIIQRHADQDYQTMAFVQQQQLQHNQSGTNINPSKIYYDQHQQPYRQPTMSPVGQHSVYHGPTQQMGSYSQKMHISPRWDELGHKVQAFVGNSGMYANRPAKEEYNIHGGFEGGRFVSPGRISSKTVRLNSTSIPHQQGVVCNPYATPDSLAWHQTDIGLQRVHGGQLPPHQNSAYPANGMKPAYFSQANALTVGVGRPGYIPGKRLEHFSPTAMRSVNAMQSPRMKTPEYQEEYPSMKYSVHPGTENSVHPESIGLNHPGYPGNFPSSSVLPGSAAIRMEFSPCQTAAARNPLSPQMQSYWQRMKTSPYGSQMQAGYNSNMICGQNMSGSIYGQQFQIHQNPEDAAYYHPHNVLPSGTAGNGSATSVLNPTNNESGPTTSERNEHKLSNAELCQINLNTKIDCMSSSLEVVGCSEPTTSPSSGGCRAEILPPRTSSCSAAPPSVPAPSSSSPRASCGEATRKVIKGSSNEELNIDSECSHPLKNLLSNPLTISAADSSKYLQSNNTLFHLSVSLVSSQSPSAATVSVVTLTVSTPMTVVVTTSLATTPIAAQCSISTATRNTVKEILMQRDGSCDFEISRKKARLSMNFEKIFSGPDGAPDYSVVHNRDGLKIRQRASKTKKKKVPTATLR